jgi:CopG antitoxin of type II toxin-antitoxin system
MAIRKTASTRSVRQSVTIPAKLVSEVRRTAKEQGLTMSRAIVALAERGVRAEAEAKEQLKSSYDRFLAENDPARKNEAGKDLIRSIFGKNAIADDSIR